MTNWATRIEDDFSKLAKNIDTKVEIISLPSPSLNWAVGNGGFVGGKIAVMYGPESAGKSLIGMLTLIEIQKKYPKGYCLLFDAEFSFNKNWFEKLGGDLSRLIVRQTNDPVQIFDYWYGELLELLQDGFPLKGIMLDSVRSIVFPKDMKEISTKQIQGGTGAAYLPSVLKRIVPIVRQYGIFTVLIQQVTDQLDMFKKMIDPYVIPDGKFLRHTADYFLMIEKLESKANTVTTGRKGMTGQERKIGHKVKVQVRKNRTADPYRWALFTLMYESGISNISEEIFDLAESIDVISHPLSGGGTTWVFGEYPSIRGKEAMIEWIDKDKKIQQEIISACYTVNDSVIKKAGREKGILTMLEDEDTE